MQFRTKIPVTIHPLFWVTAALIGFFWTQSVIGTLFMIFVILVSVLVHELGHALTARMFGLSPRIELVALGGLTYHQGDKLPKRKQFLIVLNGPLFGFGLFLLAWGLLQIPALATGFIGSLLTLFKWINLLWTVLNLVPVMPLDGGQLLRIVLESIFGAKGFRYSLLIGMALAGAISLYFFLIGQFLAGALFFLFGFQSFEMYRRLKNLTDDDQSNPIQEMMRQAEGYLQEGNKDKAIFAFEQVRQAAKEGMIYLQATQYLAFLKHEFGQTQEVYDLLAPIQKKLSPDALCLLHKVAYDLKHYTLVEELGAACFQFMPSKEIALRNALACSLQEKAQPAIGWLETAFQEGLENIHEIIKGQEFDAIRSNDLFIKFASHHSDGA